MNASASNKLTRPTGALAVCLSVLASLLSGAAPAGYRLTVEVENVRTAQGWPEQFSAALRAEATAAHTGVVEITIPDLPAGDYAVVALHDENANQQLDRNWLGVPVEQWGMSNNPPYRFAAPSFEAARFRLEHDLRIRVVLSN